MKFKHILAYILQLIITPIYNIIDSEIILYYFGCGCVPSAQSNYFNIDFNANDMRLLFYTVLTVVTIIMGLIFSKDIEGKFKRVEYITSMIITNIVLGFLLAHSRMWK